MLEEWEKSWLACAIDAEGSIWMGGQGPIRRSIRFEIYNTNLDFIKFAEQLVIKGLDEQCTAKIFIRDPGRRINNAVGKKISYTLIVTRDQCCAILKQIIPYMIIKKTKAKELMELRAKHIEMMSVASNNRIWQPQMLNGRNIRMLKDGLGRFVKLDNSGRQCLECGSMTTYVFKGRERWYTGKCKNCYEKGYRLRKKHLLSKET